VVEQTLKDNQLTDLSVANYNSNSQIIITGTKEAIAAAESIFIQAGASLYMPLKVSGAFHSPFMKNARDEFNSFAEKFTFNSPAIPVIANLNALPYEQNALRQTLVDQINHSVLWRQSMEYLIGKGETVFTEIGPGKVLTGLINKIQKQQ